MASKDRLFRCITTLQCNEASETLQAGIAARPTLRQAADIPLGEACDSIRELTCMY